MRLCSLLNTKRWDAEVAGRGDARREAYMNVMVPHGNKDGRSVSVTARAHVRACCNQRK